MIERFFRNHARSDGAMIDRNISVIQALYGVIASGNQGSGDQVFGQKFPIFLVADEIFNPDFFESAMNICSYQVNDTGDKNQEYETVENNCPYINKINSLNEFNFPYANPDQDTADGFTFRAGVTTIVDAYRAMGPGG